MTGKHLLLSLAALWLAGTSAVAEVHDGTSGKVQWSVDTETGVLTLTGAGTMSNYSGSTVTTAPWGAYAKYIKTAEVGEGITSVGNYAFYFCTQLTAVSLPGTLKSIGGSAFYGCAALDSIAIPDSVATLGTWAFAYSGLTTVALPEMLSAVPSSGFVNCSKLTSVNVPAGVTAVNNYAFDGCNSLTTIVFNGAAPATLGSSPFVELTAFVVPDSVAEAYKAAWTGRDTHVIPASQHHPRTLAVEAKADRSGIVDEVGEDSLLYITDLTVSGTINGYDLLALRNKMLNLQHLDLTEAAIVANDNQYEYYSGQYLKDDNQLGDYVFSAPQCKLVDVKLPKDLTYIGGHAFSQNSWLQSIVVPEEVNFLGTSSFETCKELKSVSIPNPVDTIRPQAFKNCSKLSSVVLGSGVKSIEADAFLSCSSLEGINFPTGLESIGDGAFYGCPLAEVKLPSSINTIADRAFGECYDLRDIYAYVIEPQAIGQSTFEETVRTNAMLHTPSTSHYLYFWDTQWSQFVNRTDFDEPYDYFFIDHDYMLDEESGRIDGEPDAELNEHSGLIVEGDTLQELGEVEINSDGTDAPSIIADDNVTADSMTIHITLKGKSWKFFCFPYDIEYSDITLVPDNDKFAGEFVMYTYNGALRAEGQSGWVRVDPSETLIAGKGYIIQGSTNGTLDITVRTESISFSADDKEQEMEAFEASDDADASWNFMGNPYLSYYDLDALSEQFDSPITIWDGNQYLAYRPGDDNYQLHPFEAFFVQKPEKLPDIEFKGNNRITYTGAQSAGAANAARRRMASVNADRLLVNLTLTDGTVTDKTRVVFNEKASAAYERECDAAKFMSLIDVPQLWTLGGKTQYAINERPTDDGIVTLAYTATQEGTLTLRATRMDTPMVLCDRMTGTEFDLTKGDYTFLTEVGTFADRFTLRRTAATAIENARVNDEEDLQRFNAAGQAADADTKGVMILKQGDKVVKRYNK